MKAQSPRCHPARRRRRPCGGRAAEGSPAPRPGVGARPFSAQGPRSHGTPGAGAGPGGTRRAARSQRGAAARCPRRSRADDGSAPGPSVSAPPRTAARLGRPAEVSDTARARPVPLALTFSDPARGPSRGAGGAGLLGARSEARVPLSAGGGGGESAGPPRAAGGHCGLGFETERCGGSRRVPTAPAAGWNAAPGRPRRPAASDLRPCARPLRGRPRFPGDEFPAAPRAARTALADAPSGGAGAQPWARRRPRRGGPWTPREPGAPHAAPAGRGPAGAQPRPPQVGDPGERRRLPRPALPWSFWGPRWHLGGFYV